MNPEIMIVFGISLVLLAVAWFVWNAEQPGPLSVPAGAKAGDLLELQPGAYKTRTAAAALQTFCPTRRGPGCSQHTQTGHAVGTTCLCLIFPPLLFPARSVVL